jgi:hypothetical protein
MIKMNATDIIGYAMPDGYMLCPSCYAEYLLDLNKSVKMPKDLAELKDNIEKISNGSIPIPREEGSPEFAGAEVDFPGSSCDWCNEIIEEETYLFQDSDLERVEVPTHLDVSEIPFEIMKKLGIDGIVEGSYVVYKIKCGERDLSDYIDIFIDIITRVEKIETVGDSEYEVDDKSGFMYIAIFY